MEAEEQRILASIVTPGPSGMPVLTVGALVSAYYDLQRIAKERGIEPYAWAVGLPNCPTSIYEASGQCTDLRAFHMPLPSQTPQRGQPRHRRRAWRMP